MRGWRRKYSMTELGLVFRDMLNLHVRTCIHCQWRMRTLTRLAHDSVMPELELEMEL